MNRAYVDPTQNNNDLKLTFYPLQLAEEETGSLICALIVFKTSLSCSKTHPSVPFPLRGLTHFPLYLPFSPGEPQAVYPEGHVDAAAGLRPHHGRAPLQLRRERRVAGAHRRLCRVRQAHHQRRKAVKQTLLKRRRRRDSLCERRKKKLTHSEKEKTCRPVLSVSLRRKTLFHDARGLPPSSRQTAQELEITTKTMF